MINLTITRNMPVDYRSLAFTLKWAHSFSQKLSAQFYAIISNYRYRLDSNQDSTLYNTVNYKIDQKILRTEFLYFHSDKTQDRIWNRRYTFIHLCREQWSLSETIPLSSRRGWSRRGRLSLHYTSVMSMRFHQLLSVSAGIRGTLFTSFGPGTELQYQEGFTRSVESINDTISYRRGEVMKIYPGLEYRLSSTTHYCSAFIPEDGCTESISVHPHDLKHDINVTH